MEPNIPSQVTQSATENQSPATQPVQTTTNNSSSKTRHILLAVVALLILIVVGGAYYLGGANQKSNPKINNNPTVINATPTSTVSSTPNLTANPGSTDVTWDTKTISRKVTGGILGNSTINIELKIPHGWIFQTNSQTSSNCTSTTITSPTKSSVNLTDLCNGWEAKYSPWPSDAIIALQQQRMNTSGLQNYYRLRYKTSTGVYNYVDAEKDANLPQDKSKDQVMDAVLIGYPPPNEGTHDFFFSAAHLTVTSNDANDLALADKIAASIVVSSITQP